MRTSVATLLALLGAPVGPAFAQQGELQLSAQGYAVNIPEEVLFARIRSATLSSTSAASSYALQLHAFGHVEGRPVPALRLRLGLDTGLVSVSDEAGVEVLIDGRPAGERVEATWLLGETFAELELGDTGVVLVRAGKLRPRIGDGALFDAYALGALVDIDLSLLPQPAPVRVKTWALLPDATFSAQSKASPFFVLETEIEIASRVWVKGLGAVLIDGDDGAVPVLDDAIVRGSLERLDQVRDRTLPNLPARLQPAAERGFARLAASMRSLSETDALFLLSSSGWLGWAGLSFRAEGARWALRGVGLLGMGQLDLTVAPGLLFELLADQELGALANGTLGELSGFGEVPLLSGFGQLELRAQLWDEVELQAFLLAMSGDTGLFPDGSGSYSSFVSLAPLITHTSLFFNGAIASAIASPTVASPAPDGAGLLAAGLGLENEFAEGWALRATLAVMGSTVPSVATSGQLYGVEGNLAVDGELGERVLVFLDLAAFVPMSYFGDLDPGLQGVVGITVRAW